MILQWYKNHQRKCCSRIYSHKQNPSGVWWNNAEGKVICTVQVSNSLLLQCIKCISGRCIAAYSFPSHLWPGGWPPPRTGTPPHFVAFSAIHLGFSLDSNAENWPMRDYWHLSEANKCFCRRSQISTSTKFIFGLPPQLNFGIKNLHRTSSRKLVFQLPSFNGLSFCELGGMLENTICLCWIVKPTPCDI